MVFKKKWVGFWCQNRGIFLHSVFLCCRALVANLWHAGQYLTHKILVSDPCVLYFGKSACCYVQMLVLLRACCFLFEMLLPPSRNVSSGERLLCIVIPMSSCSLCNVYTRIHFKTLFCYFYFFIYLLTFGFLITLRWGDTKLSLNSILSIMNFFPFCSFFFSCNFNCKLSFFWKTLDGWHNSHLNYKFALTTTNSFSCQPLPR